MKQILFFNILMLLLVIAAAGCNSRNTEPAGENAVPEVSFVDETGLRNLIANRNGKILLLNVWATWCPPCVEEFPDLVKLARNIGEEKYEIVGISVDEPDDLNGKVIPFLQKYVVPFKVFIAEIGKQEDFINTLNSSWNGAIPATFIYDSTGSQRSFSIGTKSYEQFIEELKSVK